MFISLDDALLAVVRATGLSVCRLELPGGC